MPRKIIRIIGWDVDADTGAKSVADIRENTECQTLRATNQKVGKAVMEMFERGASDFTIETKEE